MAHMRLLIVTQVVNDHDPVLGFFVRWIQEFASQCEYVTVVCLERGEYSLPGNTEILSLGKERGSSRILRLLNFYWYIFRTRGGYDTVFVHMNPIYVVLAGIFWRLYGKKVGLWYTHKQVDLKLRLAERLANVVFTASKESFRLASRKRRVMGHGIDTGIFFPPSPVDLPVNRSQTIMTSGRISPTKKIDAMIRAFAKARTERIRLVIVGEARGSLEKEYEDGLYHLVDELGLAGRVQFVGAKTQKEVAELLRQSSIFLNLSQTGSLDKAVLEAMACGVYTISSNEAFSEITDLYLQEPTIEKIAEAIDGALCGRKQGQRIGYIQEFHQLPSLVHAILNSFDTV